MKLTPYLKLVNQKFYSLQKTNYSKFSVHEERIKIRSIYTQQAVTLIQTYHLLLKNACVMVQLKASLLNY